MTEFLSSKSPLTSLGVLGSLIAFVPGLSILSVYADIIQTGLPPVVAGTMATFGAITAFIGRLRATKKIKL